MERDTDIGGPHGRFPATRASAVAAAASDDPHARRLAHETLVAAYWKPAYKYVRIQWRASNEDAKDLVQGFFVHALEKGTFARYDAGQAAFRTFLRTCLDRFVANERKAAGRLKRGGGKELLPLDFAGAEAELARGRAAADADPEALFHREWVRSLFALAVERLRTALDAEGKALHFALFARYDLDAGDGSERPTYAALAREHGIPTTQVTNFLAVARRRFREQVLALLRELTGSDDELRAEARRLLGGSAR